MQLLQCLVCQHDGAAVKLVPGSLFIILERLGHPAKALASTAPSRARSDHTAKRDGDPKVARKEECWQLVVELVSWWWVGE